ncbi:chitinase [Klebsormidium nitens]|uniref:chitinase n=1 Tax=Klebsormidium nitens TaxID=105231 RepID=A0A0U9HRP3_KLENI|nr:chitinase [Klebsormidium nitens]|eukprot:GAQ80433.1 chitinase [Klebsormidium nitens]
MGLAQLQGIVALLLAASCLLAPAKAAVNGPCNVSTTSGSLYPGVCIATTDCTASGGTFASTFCPHDPENIKCCYKTTCQGGGQCKWTTQCTTGAPTQGSCPGPVNFQCCPGTGTPSAIPPASGTPVRKGKITVYWGQSGNEPSLAATCQSGNYDNVIISFLNVFGSGRTPALNLAGHCDPRINGCLKQASQITTCQQLGVRVLLSIGGGLGDYSLASNEDGQSVARYLWNTYLGGSSSARPLGAAKLDGIDLDIESRSGGNSQTGYAALVRQLRTLMNGDSSKRYYITGAPQCIKPDYFLGPKEGTALGEAAGSFDWLNVQFYSNNCGYGYSGGGTAAVLRSWNDWSSWMASANPAMRLYLGIRASSGSKDYMDPATLAGLLPLLQKSSNYGGVMLWDVLSDNRNVINGKPFSANIRGLV